MSTFQNTRAFAKELDNQDELKSYRDKYFIPQHEGKDVLYFTGNSLGLQPKSVKSYIEQELNDWAKFGVEGHFHAKNPWFSYHELFTEKCAKLVGAKPGEVVMMNQLTVNLHLMMASFYRPTKERFKILCEAKAFPSDQYALESQARIHGFAYDEAVVEVSPREGEVLIRTEDVLAAIEKHKNELAIVIIGGVNYYTGQVFEMEKITKAGHDAGAFVGWDLAHAAGNIPMELNKWNVDFAVWCSYKYLNSGPGGVSGAFIHERHHKTNLPRLAGWWGHEKETRFKMNKGFIPVESAEGWQLSNAPIMSMAVHAAAVDLFAEVGMDKLRAKSLKLTDYMAFVIAETNKALPKDKQLEIITPLDYASRGCQLSIVAHGSGKDLFNKLLAAGVIADWREPNVIRIAPVPMYNTFEDCFAFGEMLGKFI